MTVTHTPLETTSTNISLNPLLMTEKLPVTPQYADESQQLFTRTFTNKQK
jgi:hypothetical protein